MSLSVPVLLPTPAAAGSGLSLLGKEVHIPQICASSNIPLWLHPGRRRGTLSCFPPSSSVCFPSWVQIAGGACSPLMISRLSWCTAEYRTKQGSGNDGCQGWGGRMGERQATGEEKDGRATWSAHSLLTWRKIQMCPLELGSCPEAFPEHFSSATLSFASYVALGWAQQPCPCCLSLSLHPSFSGCTLCAELYPSSLLQGLLGMPSMSMAMGPISTPFTVPSASSSPGPGLFGPIWPPSGDFRGGS